MYKLEYTKIIARLHQWLSIMNTSKILFLFWFSKLDCYIESSRGVFSFLGILNMRNEKNIAFIDWQNFHLSLKADGWAVDLEKFRVFLNDKFNVKEAYYFLGFVSEDEEDLYAFL